MRTAVPTASSRFLILSENGAISSCQFDRPAVSRSSRGVMKIRPQGLDNRDTGV